MSAYLGIQPVLSAPKKQELQMGSFLPMPMPMPRFERHAELTPTQLKLLELVRRDIRDVSSVQPIHSVLASAYWKPALKNTVGEITEELASLRPTNIPLSVKAFVLGAGLSAALLFATTTLLPSPDNKFGGILIGLIALLALPIIDAEFTNRRLKKEFELIPLESDNLPSLKMILNESCTAEQFGNFVEHDLLPRVSIGHFRSLANESGTCLHDIMFWARGDLHFSGTTWQTIHKVIEDLGVNDDISLRVKAALLVIERDTTLDEASITEINAALAELASMPT